MIEDIREYPEPETRAYEVEADSIKVKVGTVTVEAERKGEGVLSPFVTKVLFDGKGPPIAITRIELVADVNDEKPWQIKITGYPLQRRD